MKRIRHNPEQIISKLREADALLAVGKSLAHVVQHLGVREQTCYRWRNQFGGMKAEGAKRLKALEHENSRLKKLVANQALDMAILKVPGKRRSPARRRATVKHVQEKLSVSQRRACRVLEQHRSTQRYEPRRADDEPRLLAAMHEHVRRNPRFGYRRIHRELVTTGWRVSRKRIFRLWKQEGFKAPPLAVYW
jgi:putative transposase